MQPSEPFNHEVEHIISAYMNQVCMWMTAGLLLSAIAAHITGNSEAVRQYVFSNLLILIPLVLLEVLAVFFIMVYLEEMSSLAAALTFIFYSIATGIGISMIFIAIPVVTISNVFFVLSISYLIMTVYGAVTKRDVTEQCCILIFLLVGVVSAVSINFILHYSFIDFIVSCAVVVLFAGIMTNKRWRLHELATREEISDDLCREERDTSEVSHFAIIGALKLYIFR